MYKPLFLAIAACLLTVGCSQAAQSAGANLSNTFLLGAWHLKSGESGCNERLVFTADHQDMTSHGATSGAPVSGYVVSGQTIIVGGSPGVIETFSYTVVDDNTISQPQMSGACVWSRG